jgi:NAD(P)H-nitrite reductase large subunit
MTAHALKIATELSRRPAGLPVGSGIIVDGFLRTADESIFAAGDVAEVGGHLYPFVSPIRSQAQWLADHIEGRTGAVEPAALLADGQDPRLQAAGRGAYSGVT